MNSKEILEMLAELEHEQWIFWAKSIIKSEKISDKRKNRWEKLFIPYCDLNKNQKEQDRIWARKIMRMLEID